MFVTMYLFIIYLTNPPVLKSIKLGIVVLNRIIIYIVYITAPYLNNIFMLRGGRTSFNVQ